MENIIKLLQEKIGISKAQAEKLIELLKGVFGDSTSDLKDFRSKVTRKLEELDDETDDNAVKGSDTMNDYMDKIRSLFGSSESVHTKSYKK